MSLRKLAERTAWKLAGVNRPGRIHPTSSIKTTANPFEIQPAREDRLLLLSPHPDDDLIGCGGLMCRALSEGALVRVVYVTDGARGGDSSQRRREVAACREMCRVEFGTTFEAIFLEHPELAIQRRKLQQEIVSLMVEDPPTCFLAPHAGDNHRDHLEVHGVARDLRPRLAQEHCLTLGYEVWSTLNPGAFVDISAFEGLKRALIGLHQSQTRMKDYASMILGLNLYRGGCLPGPVRLAEVFEIL